MYFNPATPGVVPQSLNCQPILTEESLVANTCLFVDTEFMEAWEEPCSTMGAGNGVEKYHAGDKVPFDLELGDGETFIYDPDQGLPAEFFDIYTMEGMESEEAYSADEFFSPEPSDVPRSGEGKILDWIEGAANFVLDHPGMIMSYLIIAVRTILAPRRRSSYEELQAEYYLDDEEGEGATGTPRTLPIAGKKQGACDQCGKSDHCVLDATGHLTCRDCLDPSSQLARV